MKILVAMTVTVGLALLSLLIIAVPILVAIPLYQAGMSPWLIAVLTGGWSIGIAYAIRAALLRLTQPSGDPAPGYDPIHRPDGTA